MALNILQQNYSPVMRPAVEGMIVDTTPHSIAHRTAETSTGIGFGRAVSQGTLSDRGAILGGSAFIGITVRDITRDGVVIDPGAVRIAADLYPQYVEIPVMTRGRVWCIAQSTVAANGAVYYDTTTGVLMGSASGAAAHGSITFTQNPTAGSTVVINGSTITFRASGASGSEVNIHGTLGDTLKALADFLNAGGNSNDANITPLSYQSYPVIPAGPQAGANTLLIADKTVGTGGNSIAYSTTVTGATRAASTLLGGTASGTLISGARWITAAIAGDLSQVALSQQI